MTSPGFSIKMFDSAAVYLAHKSQYDSAYVSVMSSGRFIGGEEVYLLEEEVASYLSVHHVISCANGTDALVIALMALRLKLGDEVIVPAYNYISAVEAVMLLGLVPVFVDVDPISFNLEPSHLQFVIGERTRAIIVTHLFGQMADIDAIIGVAKKSGLYVVEDFAQAFGSYIEGHLSGSKRYAGTIGDIGCCSFFPTKNLACFGDGGMICTRDGELAVTLRAIANHGQLKEKYDHQFVGLNSRLDTLQAAFLRINLRCLEDKLNIQKINAATYQQRIGHIGEIRIPACHSFTTRTFHQYSIVLHQEDIRDKLRQYLADHGIETKVYYPMPVHKQNAYKAFNRHPFPVSEALSRRIVSLPVHEKLNLEDIHYVCDHVIAFFQYDD